MVTLVKLHDLKKEFDLLAEKIIEKKNNDAGEQIKYIVRDMDSLMSEMEVWAMFSEDIEMRDERIVSEMKRLVNSSKGVAETGKLAMRRLVGLDSANAWSMRSELLEKGVPKTIYIASTAGCDSAAAWEVREHFKNDANCQQDIAHSLTGLESDKSIQLRLFLLNNDVTRKSDIIKSLAGVDADWAWTMRDNLIKNIVKSTIMGDIAIVLTSIAGIDSERAWKMRDDTISKGLRKSNLLGYIDGLDSERAWALRDEEIEKTNPDYMSIASSLAGLDTERAWNMREILRQAGDKVWLASLVGIFSEKAWNIRESLLRKAQAVSELEVIRSINGDYSTSPLVICKNKK